MKPLKTERYPDEDPLVKPGLACWHCGAEIVIQENAFRVNGAYLHLPCVEPYAADLRKRGVNFNSLEKPCVEPYARAIQARYNEHQATRDGGGIVREMDFRSMSDAQLRRYMAHNSDSYDLCLQAQEELERRQRPSLTQQQQMIVDGFNKQGPKRSRELPVHLL